MGMRVRIGPFSVSSRGRVGVRAGPVSFYGGGRRRRRSSGSGCGALLVVLLVFGVIAIAIQYWYVTLPVLAVIGVVVFFSAQAQRGRAAEVASQQAEADQQSRERAAEVARQEAEAERRRHQAALVRAAAEERRWLASPPPPLTLPGRFTENWLAANVPQLHPGQVPVLMEELHDRGWTDERIERRVAPHLARNPFYKASSAFRKPQ